MVRPADVKLTETLWRYATLFRDSVDAEAGSNREASRSVPSASGKRSIFSQPCRQLGLTAASSAADTTLGAAPNGVQAARVTGIVEVCVCRLTTAPAFDSLLLPQA